jgi:hypothetical protein
VIEETRTVDLKDKRLDERFREVLSQLGERPAASIPAACGGYAEMAAAYRFFDNPKVTFTNVLMAHAEATRQRMQAQPVVLFVQDTTEVDVTRPEQQVIGVGPLDGGTRFGALLHVLHAFVPDGTPLGTLQAEAWVRADAPVDPDPRRRPIEEKESHRWVATLRQAQVEARRLPQTRVVCLADSEADIYELLVAGQAEPRSAEWIVRAAQNRVVLSDPQATAPESSAEGGAAVSAPYVREQVLRQAVLFTQTISVRGRKLKVRCSRHRRQQPRQSRRAEIEVRAARVTLRPPRRPGGRLPEVSVNVVLAHEINPPPGEEPVEWVLLTSLPIEYIDQVREVLQYYGVRWMVEVLFRTLKSGCRVETRRFEHVDRLLPCLGVYLLVAWRTLYVCRLGRSCPDLDCQAVFEPAEWKAVYQVVHRARPPSQPPRLAEMVRMVAQLGGYVNKPRRDPPGPQTVWLGLQRTYDMAQCWLLFGPEAAP